DDRQWLACYYQAASPLRVQLGLETRRASSPAQTSAAPPMPQPANIPNDANGAAARMASSSFNGPGSFTITPGNGQVWQQINGDTSYAHWKEPAGNYLVTITRGFLGSRNVSVQGEPGLFRVRRLDQ